MHDFTPDLGRLADRIVDYARWRVGLDPVPLDATASPEALEARAGATVTPEGLGGERALALFAEVLAPHCLSVDHPGYLAFVPAAPTEAAVLFDLVVGASSIYAGSWLEGAGAVYAENQALAWLAGLAMLPEGAGGCFVSGGTIGNLSALVAARHRAAARTASTASTGSAAGRTERWALVASEESHSSIAAAARVMDAELVLVPGDGRGRLVGAAVAPALDDLGDRVAAVVATAGTTNLGIVDDLASVGALCRSRGVWFHVDAAYGGAGLAAPSVRQRFDGIEHADSLIVDPHKWLFAPFDACALIYRDPESARAAHAQHASYLDVLKTHGDWNPSDFAVHLTRRARGLPFWFSLATHGTDAYRAAIEATLQLAGAAAAMIAAAAHLELVVEPSLSVVVFRRKGWEEHDYLRWCEDLLGRGQAFVVPTRYRGEPVLRFCFVNPRTTVELVSEILATLG